MTQLSRHPLLSPEGLIRQRALKIARTSRPPASLSKDAQRRAKDRQRQNAAAREAENRQNAERVRAKRDRDNRARFPDFFKVTESPEFRQWWEEATGEKWGEKHTALPEKTLPEIADALERQKWAAQLEQAKDQRARRELAFKKADLQARIEHHRGVLEKYGKNGSRPYYWRGVMLILATPPWADKDAIKAVYAESERLGADFAVDHIVPLCGETVCGLHVAENLRVLCRRENSRKSNKWPRTGVDADPKTGKLHIS